MHPSQPQERLLCKCSLNLLPAFADRYSEAAMPVTGQFNIITLKTAHEIAFSPDETRAILCGKREIIAIDPNTGASFFTVRPLANPSHIDFSPDGSRVVIKNTRGHTIILDALSGRTLRDFRNRDEGEGAAALFSADGRSVASISWEGLVTIRDAKSGRTVFSDVHPGIATVTGFSSSKRRQFAYCIAYPWNSNGSRPAPKIVLRAWPFAKSKPRELPHRWRSVQAIQLSPSGRSLAVIHITGHDILEIVSVPGGRPLARKPMRIGGCPSSVQWSADEKLLAVMSDEKCFVLQMPSLKPLHKINIPYGCYAAFSPSGRFLAIGSWKQSFIVRVDELDVFKSP
jgi:WD40 repeat protein